MYIAISPQKVSGSYSKSVADFVSYLEKENESRSEGEMEHFFNQYGDEISAETVIETIDKNTSKLKLNEPKFYSITVSPSARELKQLQHSSEDLKRYTKAIMHDYVSAFNREISGKPISINDIVYFAKIEHERTYKGTDKVVQENQPFATKILELKTELRKIEQGLKTGNTKDIVKDINRLEQEAPHKQDGKRIVQGMEKSGNQSHSHIIVSRKDASNSVSLSPGSKYKASDVEFNGKQVKRGFNRDEFFTKAEQRFDTTFGYKRNFAESYTSKKLYVKHPDRYFKILLGLPTNERAIAFKILGRSGIKIPHIPTNTGQLAFSALRLLKRGLGVAMKSGSIGI